MRLLARGIEAALGGPLLPPLGDNAGGMRADARCDVHHLAGRRHFEIERPIDRRLQSRNIVVADVAAVLPQMRRDAIGARRNRNLGCAQRIRMWPAPRVPHRSDVVDVHSEAELGDSHAGTGRPRSN